MSDKLELIDAANLLEERLSEIRSELDFINDEERRLQKERSEIEEQLEAIYSVIKEPIGKGDDTDGKVS